MAKFNWKNAKESKRTVGGGSGMEFTQKATYEIGDYKRYIIPALIDKNGEISPVIKVAPIHTVLTDGDIRFPSKNGGRDYKPREIRCMNPLSQVDEEDKAKILESEHPDYCVACLMASLESKAFFANVADRFGDIETYKAQDKSVKTAFAAENKKTFVENYDRKKGTNRYAMQLLLLELETTTETKNVGNTSATMTYTKPVLDAEGKPKYKPVFFKVSASRLDKFENAVTTALQNETLSESNLYPLEDGTLTTFIDFEAIYPVKANKMESASDLTFRAVKPADSVISPEFIADVQAESAKLIASADSAWKNTFREYKYLTRDEFVNLMADNGDHYEDLKTKYFDNKDAEFIGKIFATARGEKNVFTKQSNPAELKEVPTETETASTTESVNVADSEALAGSADLLNI